MNPNQGFIPPPGHNVLSIPKYGQQYFHTLVTDESQVPVQPYSSFDYRDPVHKLFRFKAFRNFVWPATCLIDSNVVRDVQWDYPVDFYNRLIPGLRLATIFMDRAKPFFLHMYRANTTRLRNGRVTLDPNFVPNNIDHFALDQAWDQMSQDLMWTYLAPKAATQQVINGTTAAMWDSHPQSNRNWMPQVGIAQELIYALALPDWPRRPLAQREAMLVHWAQLLVHELAHALWYYRNWEDQYQYINTPWIDRQEPRIPPAIWNEVGYITSLVLFGFAFDSVWPINQAQPNRNGEDGLRATYYSHRDYLVVAGTRRVSRETIHSFFSRNTWAMNARGRPRTLDIYLLDLTAAELSGVPTHIPVANGQPQSPPQVPAVMQPPQNNP